ncbi:hypothetical protein AAY42_11475 [Flagellimonas eckloniae]|uniref:Uncharacterized protein n=1 Tax=Flagellimonas eckloniae TaxID=346185 RepID=A0A0Q0XN23_9FLAO|nr:hypothetical protein AAY42_11475 [Allomuricauda eckloniae]
MKKPTNNSIRVFKFIATFVENKAFKDIKGFVKIKHYTVKMLELWDLSENLKSFLLHNIVFWKGRDINQMKNALSFFHFVALRDCCNDRLGCWVKVKKV